MVISSITFDYEDSIMQIIPVEIENTNKRFDEKVIHHFLELARVLVLNHVASFIVNPSYSIM